MPVRKMPSFYRPLLTLAFFLSVLFSNSGTQAQEATAGLPRPWQINMQETVTSFGREMSAFHHNLLLLVTVICLFVAVLLLIVIFRFREKKHPVPSKTTHHTGLEIAWTIIPVLILVAISVPSFRLLRDQLTIPKADIVVKATGYSWYWGYEYPSDQGGFKFDSIMVPEENLKPGDLRLLTVDNEMVVPVNKVVKLQTTSADVIHSWAVPAFGLKIDAIPGRLNEMWFKAEREGVYYGQCSELCGNGHAFMPIVVRVVNEAAYTAWLDDAKKKYALNSSPMNIASTR
ncbi:cytochrome c oxidase subunit II [Microvirga sp. W0021]|uniref:Cytochrome c oxidase subunit 2 n=1 Tax=Hohaiivirga grylli TaxID=3133970 RepID=A0ABV0BHB5_9HYPH